MPSQTWPRSCASTPARRRCTPRARSGPASSSLPRRPGRPSARSTRLVAFADLEAALAALPGATVALEGSEGLLAMLAELATDIGAQPVRLPPGGKQAYHAAAVLAAGGFVGLLDAITEAARGAGLDEAGALAIYGPLIRGSLANAERLGVEAALTGPFVRGDEGTVRGHLAALSRLAPGRAAGATGHSPAGAGHGRPPRRAGRGTRRRAAPPAGELRGATIGTCSAASARSASPPPGHPLRDCRLRAVATPTRSRAVTRAPSRASRRRPGQPRCATHSAPSVGRRAARRSMPGRGRPRATIRPPRCAGRRLRRALHDPRTWQACPGPPEVADPREAVGQTVTRAFSAGASCCASSAGGREVLLGRRRRDRDGVTLVAAQGHAGRRGDRGADGPARGPRGDRPGGAHPGQRG